MGADVNQETLAKVLRVSRTTVSRCFTNHPGIHPETRARVFALAARLGYHYQEMRHPRPAARRGSRLRVLRVLIGLKKDDYDRNVFQNPGMFLLQGVSEYALLHRLMVKVDYVDPLDDSLKDPSYRALRLSKRDRTLGFVFIYPFPPSILEQLTEQWAGVSLVEQFGADRVDCVDVDHFKGIAGVMDLLWEAGHRRIGFYTAPYRIPSAWVFRRYSAYLEVLARRGVAVPHGDVVHMHTPYGARLDPGYDQVAALVRQGVTAWVCAADHAAYNLITALRLRALRVPEDVSVTGFDGIEPPAGMSPLTTARIPYAEIGKAGCRFLAERFDRPHLPVRHLLLGPTVLPGTTVARPRSIRG
jgi:DNA-binding LacI/PurR family transcriptional regulator